MEVKDCGKITLSENVVITDPCYNLENTNYLIRSNNFLPGKYNCSLVYKEGRVKEQILTHEDYPSKTISTNIGNIGVDSGQAGVFDLSIFPKEKEIKDKFYNDCCDVTLKGYDENNAIYRLKDLIETTSFRLENNGNLKNENLDKLNINEEEFKILKKTLEEDLDEYRKELKILEEKNIPFLQGGIIYNKGFLSSTGWGDGIYTVYANKNSKGLITAIKIKFM